MPKKPELKIEPCTDCPIPPNMVVKEMPADSGTRYDIQCRECGDKWTEIIDEQ